MKSKMLLSLTIVVLAGALISCSEDEVKLKGDKDVVHEGDKWAVSLIDSYVLMDVSTSGMVNKTGSKADAGSFYFVEGENKGSFEMNIEGYNKEDLFSFTKDANGNIDIVQVQQSVGVTTNQNILVISGTQTSETEIILDAVSIVKESTTTVFSLTATQITLTKQ